MAIFRSVSDGINRVWNYMSPQKTQQRREKPFSFKVPELPNHAKKLSKHHAATPATSLERRQSYFQQWSPRTPSPGSDVDATLLPPSPPTSAPQLPDDFEGDTLLPESPSSPNGTKAGSSEDEWNANEDTMVVDDGTYMEYSKAIDPDEERHRRARQGRELRDAGWTEDAVFLFQKLRMRGFEPLLPIDWLYDFETVPEDLFTANIDKAFIKPAEGSDYHAQRALTSLFDLGGRVRDAWHTRAHVRTPAYHIERAINNFTRWAMKDGGVDTIWSGLPLFETVAFGRNVDTAIGEREMLRKLGQLHENWSQALHTETAGSCLSPTGPEVPALYGVTASHTIMAFTSYAPPSEENPTPQLRLIAIFDFGKDGYDVWNSLAIAIFIVHCRNRMMQLKDCLSQPDYSTDEDPDL
ncbi:hypothetical protein T440DRAFT_551053 [Plenodomus tracheiphilus IPT5]|uniref:Uncharacterized protein n=1 Tax=Plenodomus tracheiphilus IPT5 TaxID=1408161 RepID=A0A6A7BMM9_9PLEO|nr:hypothetical protein T440DRAFT_551053 [Plenodomus tracheiphilus IPT5]